MQYLKQFFVVMFLLVCQTTWAAELATVTVKTWYEVEEPLSALAPPGAIIEVNKKQVAIAGKDSRATFQVPAGTWHIRAWYPGEAEGGGAGREVITVSAGEKREVNLYMDSRYLDEPATLHLRELNQQVLPVDFTAFTLEFVDAMGDKVKLDDDASFRIERSPYNPLDKFPNYVQLGQHFKIENGILACKDIEGLRAALNGTEGLIQLTAVVFNTKTVWGHEENVNFYLGYHDIDGLLVAPPSMPDLPIANQEVKLTFEPNDAMDPNTKPQTFTAITDTHGRFKFTKMPAAVPLIAFYGKYKGQFFNTEELFPLDASGDLRFMPLGAAENDRMLRAVSFWPNNPKPKKVIDRTQQYQADQKKSIRAEELQKIMEEYMQPSAEKTGEISTGFLRAWTGMQNVAYPVKGSIVVPQGTEKIVLRYIAGSEEWPKYVREQSQFNDVWDVWVELVDGTNQILHKVQSRVNSQLNNFPVWQSNGTTGGLLKFIDVSPYTKNGPITARLKIVAINIADSLYATQVVADLSVAKQVRILKVTPDVVIPTKGDSKFFSIPRPPQKNTFQRYFLLDLERPPEATVEEVRYVLTSDTSPASKDMLQWKNTPNWEWINPTQIKARVTFEDGEGVSWSGDPPLHEFAYQFQVTFKLDGLYYTDIKRSLPMKALWNMPDGLPRFSTRDRGGDDWCAKSTYAWLKDYGHLLPPINDISGEHARNLGHKTHTTGADIDTYHFTHLAARVNGDENYKKLEQYMNKAVIGDLSSLTVVKDWFLTARSRLSQLFAVQNVERVIFPKGGELPQLRGGWVGEFLAKGQVLSKNGAILDLGIGTWAYPGQIIHDPDHNNHLHIDIKE